jgi:uncharacterized protein
MNIAEELQKLQQLRESGAISDEEFNQAKAKLLSQSAYAGGGIPVTPLDVEKQTRLWAMLLHLSQLASFIVPLAGFVAPILIWQIKQTELPGIDVHGKIVMNWIISELLYGLVGFLLLFVVVGLPLLIILGVLGIVFPIMGGIKANNGEVWKYPLSIPFFS